MQPPALQQRPKRQLHARASGVAARQLTLLDGSLLVHGSVHCNRQHISSTRCCCQQAADAGPSNLCQHTRASAHRYARAHMGSVHGVLSPRPLLLTCLPWLPRRVRNRRPGRNGHNRQRHRHPIPGRWGHSSNYIRLISSSGSMVPALCMLQQHSEIWVLNTQPRLHAPPAHVPLQTGTRRWPWPATCCQVGVRSA